MNELTIRNLNLNPQPCTKINAKWIMGLNREQTIKFLERNIAWSLWNLGLSEKFLDLTLNVWSIKGTINLFSST